jgi:Holliday junction resolvase RusA-like endonuclease
VISGEVWVPGEIRPAPRPRVAGGRAYMPSWYGRQTTLIARHLAATLEPLPVAPTAVDLAVVVARPPSHRTKAGALSKGAPGWPPARAGDVDNLAKGILDAAVHAGVLPDDSQVVDLHVTKRYAEAGEDPGAHLRINIRGEKIDPSAGVLIGRAGR